MNQNKDQVIILTGGNGLIGSEVISLLRSRGAVVINFDIKKIDNDKDFIQCNITQVSSIKKSVSDVIKKYGN